jgi:hypothetical protein
MPNSKDKTKIHTQMKLSLSLFVNARILLRPIQEASTGSYIAKYMRMDKWFLGTRVVARERL